jgi:preprotein translocase SecF subunit
VNVNTKKPYSFYAHRKLLYSISIAFMVIGIIGILLRGGVALDIQFTGGALLKYTYQGEINADDVAGAASEILGRQTTAQLTNDYVTHENRVVLTLAGEYGMSSDEQTNFLSKLNEKFPSAKFVNAESSLVQPFYGQRFLQRSLLAVILAVILILIYEWITFRKIGGLLAGLSAIIALFHDLAIAFFTCVIAGVPIGDSFVAVALTIVGYSINDTIVVFDRIRENRRVYPKESLETIADLSVSQTMTRSINTNIAVTVSVFLIYILATRASLDSVVAFALPMAISSVLSIYSTLALCAPLWVTMQKHREKKRPHSGNKPEPNKKPEPAKA